MCMFTLWCKFEYFIFTRFLGSTLTKKMKQAESVSQSTTEDLSRMAADSNG